MSRLLSSVAFPLSLLLMVVSCSKTVQIQQARFAPYVITLLSKSGDVKQHSNKFTLEIRIEASNQLASVNRVQIETSVPGKGPVFNVVSPVRATAPGRYEFDADFPMPGQWSLLVTFENGRAQFNLTVP